MPTSPGFLITGVCLLSGLSERTGNIFSTATVWFQPGGNVTVTTTNSCNKVGGTYSLASITVNSFLQYGYYRTGVGLCRRWVCILNRNRAAAHDLCMDLSGPAQRLITTIPAFLLLIFPPTATSGNFNRNSQYLPCEHQRSIQFL